MRVALLPLLLVVVVSVSVSAAAHQAQRARVVVQPSRVQRVRVGPELFGLNNEAQLVRIDPNDGEQTAIGKPLAYEAIAQGLAAMDSYNGGVYYLIAYNESNAVTALVGLSLTSGAVVCDRALPFEQSAFVGVGQAIAFDPKTKEVIAFGRDHRYHDQHSLMRINPKTGAMRSVAQVGGIDVLGGPSAYDPVSDTMWVSIAFNNSGDISISLVGYHTLTGKVVGKVPLRAGTMSYDPVSGKIFGLGIHSVNGTLHRTLLAIDPKTGDATTIGDVNGWVMEDGDMSALDPIERRLVVLLQSTSPSGGAASPSDPPPNLKFNLVSIDLNSAAVVTHPYECDLNTNAGCPWSIAYYVPA